jgi:tRNA 2-selenouridine synthase
MVRTADIDMLTGHIDLIPVVDVRSSSEYSRGHIPGAVNIPLFDDEERTLVGTMYHRSGRDASVLVGLDIVGPKLSGMVKQAKAQASSGEMVVYCWRGGMRSAAMAWLFDLAGIHTTVVNGGYKAYRRYVSQSFEINTPMAVIGGMTGSGKTELLNALKASGEQVIDLEQMACHKGSAFGSLGQHPQPTNEQFENDLSAIWRNIDRNRTVWIEDESQSIGFNRIPDAMFDQMIHSPLILMQMNKASRIRRLNREYSGFDPRLLQEAVLRISKRLGAVNTSKAIEAIQKNDFLKAIEIVLTYYDKTYSHSIASRDGQPSWQVILHDDDPLGNAQMLIEYYHHRID